MSPDLINIELARLVENSSAWQLRFKRYQQLQDAGLSCDEAATIVTAAYLADLAPDLAETKRAAA